MKFGSSFIGQPVYYTLRKDMPLGYIVGVSNIGDYNNIFVLVDVGDGIEYESYNIKLLEPCKGIF